MKLVFLFLSLLAVVSCGRKSGNTTKVGASGGGTYGSANAIYGQVRIYQDCGGTSARIQLGDSNGYQVQEQTVQNYGSYSFQVTPGTYYHLAATASYCSISTLGKGPILARGEAIPICLGQACSTNQKMTVSTSKVTLSQKANVTQNGFCSWQSWGCEFGIVGNGGSLFESALFSKRRSRPPSNSRWLTFLTTTGFLRHPPITAKAGTSVSRPTGK